MSGEKKEPRNIWKGKFSTLLLINIMPNKEKAFLFGGVSFQVMQPPPQKTSTATNLRTSVLNADPKISF